VSSASHTSASSLSSWSYVDVVVSVLVLVDVLVLVLVLANIAEGTGRVTAADGARHFAIERGSAMECAAGLGVVRLLGVGTDEQHRQAVELLGRMVSMLSNLSR
jgi:hypothetical protein